jgi:hypothetical protein
MRGVLFPASTFSISNLKGVSIMKNCTRILALVLSMVLGGAAFAQDSFRYDQSQIIIVVSGDAAFTYAKFPTFIELKGFISEKMESADQNVARSSPAVYVIRIVGVGEEATLKAGKDWIGDGRSSASLDDAEFEWLRSVVARAGGKKGLGADNVDEFVRYQLNRQRDSAWTPML